MKPTLFVLTLSTFCFFARPLAAAEPMEVSWDQLCHATDDHELTITTSDGQTIEGYCTSINVNELRVSTGDNRIAKIGRALLAKIEMHRAKRSQTKVMAKSWKKAMDHSTDLLLAAPLGLVAVPGVVAWGAISMPFCLLGDLFHLGHSTVEIKLT